jgi:hypothetical protein
MPDAAGSETASSDVGGDTADGQGGQAEGGDDASDAAEAGDDGASDAAEAGDDGATDAADVGTDAMGVAADATEEDDMSDASDTGAD